VRLPHTVKTLPYNYCNENEYQRVSGYRREFFAPKEWQGRTVLLTFGAVAHDATVFHRSAQKILTLMLPQSCERKKHSVPYFFRFCRKSC